MKGFAYLVISDIQVCMYVCKARDINILVQKGEFRESIYGNCIQ